MIACHKNAIYFDFEIHSKRRSLNSISKGNELEDQLYKYLLDQQEEGGLVFDTHPADLCKIFKKKKYFSRVRNADVEFDVVMEIYRRDRKAPYLHVIFECKNYKNAVPESAIRILSHQLEDIFKHSAKGVIVVSSRLQSGAEQLARNSGISIIKYDEHGLETIADRKGRNFIENKFVESQIIENGRPAKSLKFSAYYDGMFFSTVGQLLNQIDPDTSKRTNSTNQNACISVPYIPIKDIKKSAQSILDQIGYKEGPVDLTAACSHLCLDLQSTQEYETDAEGSLVLGSANFDRKSIKIYSHANENRERFTIGHEIGHFSLSHGKYLRSETTIKNDLLITTEREDNFNYERLELQANLFSSNLLLPDNNFIQQTEKYRKILEIRDRGHGYIYVDDQPCNLSAFFELLRLLSLHFCASIQAIDIKLRSLNMISDKRKMNTAYEHLKYLRS